jgi:hypothetical protein
MRPPMNSKEDIADLNRVVMNYNLLADMLMRIKGTPLASDPAVMEQMQELQNAFARHYEQVKKLTGVISSGKGVANNQRPRLRLVKG